MNTKQIEERLQDYINNMDIDDYIDLWNNYNKEFGNDEKIIHYINELRDDEYLKSLDPYDICENCENVTLNDKYYYVDGFKYISFNDIYDLCDDLELVNAIIDNYDSYNNYDIDVILNGKQEVKTWKNITY